MNELRNVDRQEEITSVMACMYCESLYSKSDVVSLEGTTRREPNTMQGCCHKAAKIAVINEARTTCKTAVVPIVQATSQVTDSAKAR